VLHVRPSESPDQLRYLRDTIDAYRRRLDRETDEEVRRYLWQRLLELESQLAKQPSAPRRPRASDGDEPPSGPGGRGVSLPPSGR
jgi:hypothetical protein